MTERPTLAMIPKCGSDGMGNLLSKNGFGGSFALRERLAIASTNPGVLVRF